MTLDKVRHLIARAAHPSTPVEEARTSAVIACRLIVEHQLDLRAPGDVTQTAAFDWFDLLRVVVKAAATQSRDDFVRHGPHPPPRPKVTIDDFMRASEASARQNPKGGTKKVRKRRAKRRTP